MDHEVLTALRSGFMAGDSTVNELVDIYNSFFKAIDKGINLRGIQITLKDRNPFLNQGCSTIDTTRVLVQKIPMSYDNSEIEKAH